MKSKTIKRVLKQRISNQEVDEIKSKLPILPKRQERISTIAWNGSMRKLSVNLVLNELFMFYEVVFAAWLFSLLYVVFKFFSVHKTI